MKAAAQNMNVNLASFHSQARAESFEHLQRQLKQGFDLDSNHQAQEAQGKFISNLGYGENSSQAAQVKQYLV